MRFPGWLFLPTALLVSSPVLSAPKSKKVATTQATAAKAAAGPAVHVLSDLYVARLLSRQLAAYKQSPKTRARALNLLQQALTKAHGVSSKHSQLAVARARIAKASALL